MQTRKDLRVAESQWRATKNDVPTPHTQRLPEPPVQIFFKEKSK